MARPKIPPPYRSKYEHRIALDLEERGIEFTYEEYELEYLSKPTGRGGFCGECGSTDLQVWRTYTPDFRLVRSGVFVEAKGKFTAQDRRKHLQVRDSHPDEDLKFIFQRDNKISRRSTTRYSDWCEKNGFEYAIGIEVPKEWL